MTIFEFSSYKLYLKKLIAENNQQRGFQATLAKAANCQPSYLSQVINGKSHLTEDHVARMAQHLGMIDVEIDYFLCLLQLAKSTSPNLQTFLENKLENIKESYNEILERIPNAKVVSKEIEQFYYSSWYWSAIHVATATNNYQTVDSIAKRFFLPATTVKAVLVKLESVGFVRRVGNQWHYVTGASHLPRRSQMTEVNHTNWRLKALQDVREDSNKSLHYSSVFAMSKKDASKVRELLLNSITKSRTISDPSKSEDVYCFNMDFFVV